MSTMKIGASSLSRPPAPRAATTVLIPVHWNSARNWETAKKSRCCPWA
ncbi:hypothetical protein ABZZ80_16890 [Streptomyces sp. NPDC006356]